MNPVEMIEAACGLAAKQIAAATSSTEKATPCKEWDVGTLVGHMVAALEGNTALLGGPAATSDPFDPQRIDASDMVSRYSEAAAGIVEAAQALDMDAMVQHPAVDTPIPVSAALMFPIFDQYVHSWDIAQATGAEGEYPEPLHSAVAGWCNEVFAGERQPGIVDPAVQAPDNASPMQELAAFLGRES